MILHGDTRGICTGGQGSGGFNGPRGEVVGLTRARGAVVIFAKQGRKKIKDGGVFAVVYI